MNEFDIGIVGSSLFAAFLAGLLTKNHAKKIALFLDSSVQHQIPREINVSFDCVMRPETWHLLQEGLSEALPTLGKIGGGLAIAKTDALLICKTPYTRDALSHLYHFLHGVDYEIERLSNNEFKNSLSAYRLSGLKFIRPNVLWPSLLAWLNTISVTIFSTQNMRINPHKGGFTTITSSDYGVGVKRLVLADEQAILTNGNERAIDKLFVRMTKFGILSQPVENFSERLILNPENSFSARKKLDNTIEILADGDGSDVARHINTNILSNELVSDNSIRVSGRCVFPTLKTKDGALFVGKLAQTGVWGCAGLGMGSVFFAPAIARFICNQSSNNELEYFSAHRGDGRRRSDLISEGCTPMDAPQ